MQYLKAVVRIVIMIGLAGILLGGLPSHAQDRFEIQVYDSETTTPGDSVVEVHVNHTSTRAGSESALAAGSTLENHFTVEPHLGLANWCEAGAYLQMLFLGTEFFRYAGVKLRFKARTTSKLANLVGLAINFEVSNVPRQIEANVWGSEIRPVADVRWGAFYASLNPIVSIDLAGPDGGRPQFQPAAKVAFALDPDIALGSEYYSAFPALFAVPGVSHRAQILLGAVDFTSQELDLNLGAGYGFIGDERWVVKAVLGFHPRSTKW